MNNLSLKQRITVTTAGIGALALSYIVLKNHDNPAVKQPRQSQVSRPLSLDKTTTQRSPQSSQTQQIPLLTGASVKKIVVRRNETVRFYAKPEQNEEVHIHGYDLMYDVSANQRKLVKFKANITGVFEIEFEHEKKQIAKLTVNP